jgi:hypothetical protein
MANRRNYMLINLILVQFMDDQLEFDRMDFIKIMTFDTVLDLVKSGYSYAERTDAKGLYEEKLGQCRKKGLRKLLESVPRRLLSPLEASV